MTAAGGVPVKLPAAAGLRRRNPEFLPDGQHDLFTGTEQRKPGIFVGSLSSAEATRLVDAVGQAVFAPSAEGSTQGYLLYAREQTLMAHTFDATRIDVPQPIHRHCPMATFPVS